MKIVIDIGHPAQLNFFKNSIKILSKRHNVFVTYVSRGKLPHIVIEELQDIKNCSLIEVGKHRNGLLSVIFEMNVFRPLLLLLKYSEIKPNVILSSGYQAGIFSKFTKTRSLQFSDDLEKGFFFISLTKFFSDQMFYPFFEDEKIKPFRALKEWSYLSPPSFIPNKKVLEPLGVKEKEYVFVREVSTNTANYLNQKDGTIESISNKISNDFQVVLSLEDKSRKSFFPSSWLILEEPIKDIHSLLYYSRFVISSGDSMAREGAQLGIPSFYCGIRNMHSNKILIDEGMLFHVKTRELVSILSKSLKKPADSVFLKKLQNKMREKFHIEWEDITNFIVSKVEANKIS